MSPRREHAAVEFAGCLQPWGARDTCAVPTPTRTSSMQERSVTTPLR